MFVVANPIISKYFAIYIFYVAFTRRRACDEGTGTFANYTQSIVFFSRNRKIPAESINLEHMTGDEWKVDVVLSLGHG
jgi:hypothetical protein